MTEDLEAYPIVVLHGWALNSHTYARLKRQLSKLYPRVLIPDLPGFGSKKKLNKPLYLRDYVDYVHKLLSQSKINKTTLVGHSFGGRIALKYAEKYPHTLEKLVLTGVPVYKENSSLKRALLLLLAKAGKKIFAFFALTKFTRFARIILYKLVGSADYLKADPVLRTTLQNILAEDLSLVAKKVNTPTLLVWGDKDLHTPLWIAVKAEKIMPNAKLMVVSDADHGLIYKDPDKFIANL